MNQITVMDFFCGAGGFSEGFQQEGFTIILGIDNWKPAIDTFNHNFNLNCKVQNVLDFYNSVEKIQELPDSTVIIGSPPCVSFSNSNKSGKADKSLGIKLVKAFLRVVAVKKHQPNSPLKAWFMENVTKSIPHIKDVFTFDDLDLSEWAVANGKLGSDIAITFSGNHTIVNSASFGCAQSRKRVISGEIISLGRLVVPPPTHRAPGNESAPIEMPLYKTLRVIRGALPQPNESQTNQLFTDPLYSGIQIERGLLTDHFYDTGLYKSEWKSSKHLKNNHPYMGLMSFPENENNPSRTITATKIGTSREAIIYRSEYNRIGDGEYRTPTVREAATLMGFPITFQLIGSEGAKWRLVGNAVCPAVSRRFAATVRKSLGLEPIDIPNVQLEVKLNNVKNLNTFAEKRFNNPPIRNKGSRFRRHPFKHGNITVTLSNYDITNQVGAELKWISSVQYGNGDGFPTLNFDDNYFTSIEPVIERFDNGKKFLEIINNGFSERIANGNRMQEMFELHQNWETYLEPTALIEQLADIIDMCCSKECFEQKEQIIFPDKKVVPQSQIMALYAINKICSIANESNIP